MKNFLSLILLALIAATAHADAVKIQINGIDGKPVAGALVRVQESSGSWLNRKTEKPIDLVSDENGVVNWESKFSLARKTDAGVPSPNQAWARVMAPGVAGVGGAGLKTGENIITLTNATNSQGVIRDENQEPVAGARLKVVSIVLLAEDGKLDNAKFLSFQDDLALEAVTDAQGKWILENLPLGAIASFEIEARGFRALEFGGPILQSAPPIFLRRGATVKGRIVRPDGTGAPHTQFYTGDILHQPRTDAGGRFEVDGLEPGSLGLQIVGDDEKLGFILPPRWVQGLVAGEVRDIGDWKGEKGVRVRGRVTDGAGKPIDKATVSVWGAGDGDGNADAKGAFDFIAQKGASMLTVYATGYIQKTSQDVPDATNGVIDLGTITLKRGQKITGVLKNQAGTPMPNVWLQAMRNNNELGGARSNAKGEFTFDGLEVGPYKIQSHGAKIVAGERFTLAATGNKPLAVTIEGREPAGQKQRAPLQARVIDENGQGVAGAQIALRVKYVGNSYSDIMAVSDADGILKSQAVGANSTLKITEVFRPGYVVGTNNLELENGEWRGEIRLQTRGLFLRGRVVDAQSQPLAGVAVALANGSDLPVATDENGEFVLPDAPQSGVQILTSDGARLAEFDVEKNGQKIEIVLPDVDPVDREKLADSIAPRAWWEWGLMNNWDNFGAARMEAIVLGMRTNANDSWGWNQFLQELARREPARFVARERELRARNTNNNDAEFENFARLAHAVAGSVDQKVEVRKWLAAEQKIKRETTAENVSALLVRAEIAAGLGDEKGSELWLDYAAQIGDYVPERGNQAWDWGHHLAHIAPDAALRFVENWTPVAQMQILQNALIASIEINDAGAAHADWQHIQKLAVVAEKAPPDTKTRVEGYVLKASDLLRQAKAEYARFLSRTDPNVAFELAKDLSPDGSELIETMPVIGRNAAKIGQYDVARKALLATFGSNVGNIEPGAFAAQIAATFDEKLGAELFARLRSNRRSRADDAENSRASLSIYAGARSQKWPGETRVLVEREWPSRLENADKTRDPENRDIDAGDYTTINLVGTMALVAPARAIEMAEQLPLRKQLRTKAFAAVLTQMLAK